MKICILSMQHVNNFGSLLQSYSLMKYVKELGHEVHFIDIQPNEEENKLRAGHINIYVEDIDKYSKNPLVRIIKKTDKYFFLRVLNRLKYEKQNRGFVEFRKNILGCDSKWNNESYDYCIIGSDEVFNCMQDTSWGFTSQLYGNVKQANHVITYAASCGSASLKNVPTEIQTIIRRTFMGVNSFSVRDTNTYNFVKALVSDNKEVEYNLDPALVGNFDEEIEKYGKAIKLPKRYCLIYAYSDRIHEKRDIDKIKSFCKERGLKAIAMGMPQQWCDEYVIANPFELLYAFKNADFVITDTFHGTIFSYKYTSRFAVMIRSSNSNKLQDLVRRLEINQHVLNSFEELSNVYSIEKNIEKCELLISDNAKRTVNYLEGSIKSDV